MICEIQLLTVLYWTYQSSCVLLIKICKILRIARFRSSLPLFFSPSIKLTCWLLSPISWYAAYHLQPTFRHIHFKSSYFWAVICNRSRTKCFQRCRVADLPRRRLCNSIAELQKPKRKGKTRSDCRKPKCDLKRNSGPGSTQRSLLRLGYRVVRKCPETPIAWSLKIIPLKIWGNCPFQLYLSKFKSYAS